MIRPYGMAQVAFKAYIQICYDSQISPERIGQTIGAAVQSAGTHLADGVIDNEEYSAATDIKIRDLSGVQIADLLEALWKNGFAAWHRTPPTFTSPHIHCVYVSLPMKKILRDQIHSFLARKNGLASNKTDAFVQSNLMESVEQSLRAAFLAHNPAAE